MLYITSGSFKEGKAKVFQDWWTKEENIKKLKDSLPNGVKHIGTYVVVVSSADHDFEQWWELDNWASLDAWKKEVDNPNSNYHKTMKELKKELRGVVEFGRTKFLRPVKESTFIQPED